MSEQASIEIRFTPSELETLIASLEAYKREQREAHQLALIFTRRAGGMSPETRAGHLEGLGEIARLRTRIRSARSLHAPTPVHSGESAHASG